MSVKLAARIMGTKAVDTDPTCEPDLRSTVPLADDKYGHVVLVSVRDQDNFKVVAEAEFSARELEDWCNETVAAIYRAREAKLAKVKPVGAKA